MKNYNTLNKIYASTPPGEIIFRTYDEGYETGYKDGKKEGDEKLKEAYQNGLNDAWECARKLSLSSVDDGGLDETVIEKLFGCRAYYVVRDTSPSEAIAKIKEYEEKLKADEIKVGDEVVIDDSIGIVTRAFPGAITCYVMRRDGSSGEEDRNDCKKTGRHFPQIAEALEKMQENKE